MSILIKGMEMPHDCPHCEFAVIGYLSPMSSDCTLYCRAVDKFKDCATEIMKDKSYEEISQYDTRPDWCPLLPLPEGHGDLIEKKSAKARFCQFCFWKHQNEDACERCAGCPIDFIPTIVPAEGGTDNG